MATLDLDALVWEMLDPWVSWAYPWVPWVQQYQWPLLISMGALVVGVGVAHGCLRRRQVSTMRLSHWATTREIRRVGAFNRTGMLLGMYDHGWYWGPWRYQYLRAPFEQNVVVIAPPGESKSAGNAIPTALACDTHDLFFVDSTGDLVAKTAAHRRTIGPVYILDLNGLTSDAINPLDYPAIRWGIHGGIHEGEDCQRAAYQFVSPAARYGSHGSEFYHKMAQWVLPMGMMYLRHGLEVIPSPRRLFRMFADTPIAKTLGAMREVGQAKGIVLLEAGANLLLQETPSEQRSDWKAAATWLLPYGDDVLARHTDETNIPWWEFQQGARPVTIYLVAKADDISGRLGTTVRLLIEQFLFHWTDRAPDAYRREGRLIFDDFGRLGYLRSVDVLVTEKRKYGLGGMFLAQSFKQLSADEVGYQGLLNSCGCWVSYRQNDYDDAVLMERKVGDEEILEPVERVSVGAFGRGGRKSSGMQLRERPLLPYERVMRLTKEDREAVVCIEHLRIQARRIHAYTDPFFRQRMTVEDGQ